MNTDFSNLNTASLTLLADGLDRAAGAASAAYLDSVYTRGDGSTLTVRLLANLVAAEAASAAADAALAARTAA